MTKSDNYREVEIKFRLGDLDSVRQKLGGIGAQA